MCYAKPGPRCSRHAADALRSALARGDAAALREAKKDFALTPKGIAALKEKGQIGKAEECLRLRNKMIAAYTENLKFEELHKELANRLGSDDFKKLIAERDVAREAYEKQLAELEELKKDEDSTFEQIRDKTNEVKEAFFNNLEAGENLNEYKNETAHLVARISDSSEMFEEEYTGDRLGNATPVGEYPSNSREWLVQRQKGIGGSDVGAILKLDPEWGDTNYKRVLEGKTIDYSKMDDSEFTQTELNESRAVLNAMQRGDAWEPVVASVFASKNPGYKVMRTKRTWQSSEDPEMMANLDGILSAREDGEPDGILEVKTGANKKDWEEGVPAGYRAQVLHYLDVTGLDYAYVAAQIDDHEYRQYRINRGEKINNKVGTVAANKTKLKNFMKKARAIRSGETSTTRTRDPHPPISYTTTPSTSVERLIAAYSGRSEEEVYNSIRRRGSETDYDAAVRAEFAASKVGSEDKVILDLETTGLSPTTGEIIEIGWTRRNNKNEVVAQGTSTFSPDSRFLRARGTGPSDVHGITPEEVAGKPHFSDPEVQKDLLDSWAGATIVAHNAPFELRFLNQNLNGFHEKDFKVIDTALLSKNFDLETPNNQLSSFVENNGGEYEDAHRAMKDAEMTADAFFSFAKKNGHID